MSGIDWSKAGECCIGAFTRGESVLYVATKFESSYDARPGFEGFNVEGGRYHVFSEIWTWHERPVLWIGEGLPPVGTVCEVLRSDLKWYRCKIFAIRGNEALFDLDPGHADSWDSGDASLFRPIRTPELIAAEEREKAIREIESISRGFFSSWRELAEHIYDAGYRK